MAKQILITGGTGYVGSHATVELLNAGYDCVVIDNLHNSHSESLHRVEQITGKKIQFYKVDLLDKVEICKVFKKHSIHAVMHFAGLKAVGESVDIPLTYYHNNLTGTLHLLQCMEEFGVYRLVFSSSATVYGTPKYLPLDERHPVGSCTNPYGKTKYFIEEMLKDLSITSKKWNIIMLRYFNPVGAHKSGLIGEDPQGLPNNLMPYVSQVAAGKRPHVNVFGSDYDTQDGTGVRDYIHVTDLARGHTAALKKVEENCGLKIYNLGSGNGYSVLEIIKGMEKACGKEIPYKLAPRRSGDVPVCYADPQLALDELHWKTELTLDGICEDTWRWQSQNPNGFRKSDNSA